MSALYKFFRTTTLNLDTLKRGEVYLCHPSNFNDPFDSIINAKANDDEILADISEFLIKENPDLTNYFDLGSLKVQWGAWANDNPNEAVAPHFTDSLKYFATDVPKDFSKYKQYVLCSALQKHRHIKRYLELTETLGVCSFSKTFQSESMWAYYADNHKGFCVEYKIDTTKISMPLRFDKVVYVDGDEYADMESVSDEGLIARSSIKKRCWQNEHEVRLIHPRKANGRIGFPGVMNSITFGAFTPNHDIEVIKELFKDPRISFYKMRMDYGGKKIVRSAIDEWD